MLKSIAMAALAALGLIAKPRAGLATARTNPGYTATPVGEENVEKATGVGHHISDWCGDPFYQWFCG
jgi:hypothetical protein